MPPACRMSEHRENSPPSQFDGSNRHHGPLLRFRQLRFPVRDHEQRRGGWANRFVHKKALSTHHIVFRSVRKPEQGDQLTEAMLLEVNHRYGTDKPVISPIKKFLAPKGDTDCKRNCSKMGFTTDLAICRRLETLHR